MKKKYTTYNYSYCIGGIHGAWCAYATCEKHIILLLFPSDVTTSRVTGLKAAKTGLNDQAKGIPFHRLRPAAIKDAYLSISGGPVPWQREGVL